MFAQAILQKESMRCGFVTGHDFSRAAKCLKIKVGFSPCGIFPIHNNRLFICTVPYAGASLIFIFRNWCRPKARGQVAFSFPGSPRTGLRPWGGSKSHLSLLSKNLRVFRKCSDSRISSKAHVDSEAFTARLRTRPFKNGVIEPVLPPRDRQRYIFQPSSPA
jgi:hypothetical protein